MWHFRRGGPGSGRRKRRQASLSVKILSLCHLLQILPSCSARLDVNPRGQTWWVLKQPAWVTFNLWAPSEETDTMGNTMCPSLGTRAGRYSCPSFGGIFSVWLGFQLMKHREGGLEASMQLLGHLLEIIDGNIASHLTIDCGYLWRIIINTGEPPGILRKAEKVKLNLHLEALYKVPVEWVNGVHLR